MVGDKWPVVALGDVLSHRNEFIRIDDLTTYKRCRVQLHAKGVVLRDEVEGAVIKTKSQQVCRKDELLVAEIDAKVGGYGLVPDVLDGAIVSSHYFLFPAHLDRLDPRFLDYFVRTPDFRDQVAARGSTNYAAIRPNHVLAYRIPLPPLSDQRRIVAKIERLAAKINEAVSLRNQIRQALEAFAISDSAAVMKSVESQHGSVPLDELILDAGYGTSSKCSPERSAGDTPVLRIPNVASEMVSWADLKFAVLPTKEKSKVTLTLGDLLVVRTNGSADLVGRSAVVDSVPEPSGFASYLIRIRANHNRVVPQYLQRVLRHLRNTGQLFDFARTTAGQYNVSLGRLRAASIPLPSLSEQQRIVDYLDGLQAKVDQVKRLQAKSAADLDALLPAILDRAFKGQL